MLETDGCFLCYLNKAKRKEKVLLVVFTMMLEKDRKYVDILTEKEWKNSLSLPLTMDFLKKSLLFFPFPFMIDGVL